MVDINKYMFPGAVAPPVDQDINIVSVENYPVLCHKRAGAKITILYYHGNGSTIQDAWITLKSLNLYGTVNLVCPEYAGENKLDPSRN